MNEDALRALVRETLARIDTRQTRPEPMTLVPADHPSLYLYSHLPPSDGPCFIEPGVTCNHCGFCQTHGH